MHSITTAKLFTVAVVQQRCVPLSVQCERQSCGTWKYKSAQQQRKLSKLLFLLLSIVYFPEFCRSLSTTSQRDDVSRYGGVKVGATNLASWFRSVGKEPNAKCQRVRINLPNCTLWLRIIVREFKGMYMLFGLRVKFGVKG